MSHVTPACLHAECGKCNGTGRLSDSQKCDDCNGSGYTCHLLPEEGYYYAADIVNHVDLDEYSALKSDEREEFRVITGVAFVCLTGGSQSRQRMATWFPVGTNTNTMLSEFIGEPL